MLQPAHSPGSPVRRAQRPANTVNWSGTLTSRATKLIRLNRAWGPEPGGASRHILIPLLTMIAIKFVFFFEDQRLSPLPIRLSHRRRW